MADAKGTKEGPESPPGSGAWGTASLALAGGASTAASLEWNGVACLHEATATVGRRLRGTRLCLELEGFDRAAEFPCPTLEAGIACSIDLTGFRLPATVLRDATERIPCEVQATLRDADGLALATATHRLEVLPSTHWCGLDRAGESLASFVTPNAPELAALARDASERLAAATGGGALDGYQSNSAERVQRIAEALFESLASRCISYLSSMPSYEHEGQKVRTASETLEARLGNCLDLSVTLAALLELAGLHATLLVGDGHATVGFATVEEHFCDPLHRGASRVRNRHDLGQLRVLEATAVCGGGSFAAALEAGSRWIAGASEMIAVIDLPAARRAGFHPLPDRRRALEAGPTTVHPTGPRPDWKVLQPVGLPKAVTGGRSPRQRRLEGWKRKLLDLSLRNRLLNDRASAGVPLAVEGDDGLATLEDVLWEERPLRLVPALARGGADAAGVRAEIASGILRSSLPEGELFARATRVDRDGRISLEEHGARSLFLAIGFLEFRPAQRPEPVRAPILLVPIRMRRISRQEGFEAVAVNEETVANLALHEHFRQAEGKDLGIGGELPVDARGIDLAAVLATVRHAVRDMPGTTVHAAAKIGTYSFKKLPLFEAMRNEEEKLLVHPIVATFLDRSAAPEVRSAPLLAPEDLRGRNPFVEARLPLPADSSQIAAVLSATAGATFVLQGPPGTGKSQTITNLLAECLVRGKRVLFVAEKAAALAVVSDRLEKAGLGAFALDLHADRATKTSFVEQVKRAKEDADARMPAERYGFAASLRSLDVALGRLERCGEALHGPGTPEDGRLTAYEAFERAIELASGPETPLPIALPRDGRRADLAERVASARSLGAAAEGLPPAAAEWLGRFDPPEAISAEAADAIARRAADAAIAVARLERNAARLATALAVPAATTLLELRAQAEFARRAARLDARLVPLVAAALGPLGERVASEAASAVAAIEAARNARDDVASRWADSLLESDLGTLVGDLRAARERFVLFRWSAARRARAALSRYAKSTLPKGFNATLAEVERLEAAQRTVAAAVPARERLRSLLEGDPGEDLTFLAAASEAAELAREHRGRFDPRGAWREGLRRPELTEAIAAIKGDFAGAWEAARSLDAALAPREPFATPQATLASLRLACESIAREPTTIAPASAFSAARREAASLGLAPLADALAAGRIAPIAAAEVAERALLAGWIRDRLANSPELADATRDRAEALRRELSASLGGYRAGVPIAIVRVARERIRDGLRRLETEDPAALRTMLGLLAVSTIRRPIRRVMAEGAAAIATLKPIVLASPLSAATHLPPDFPQFDLVVFDEASQVPTHDAACAIGRGRAAVIVGDSRQLPPTTFFDRGVDTSETAEGDEDLESLESVLDEAIAAGVPERSLLWHYRSRDERLIDFSNRRSYGGRLQTFPAPHRAHPDLGVEFRLVGGLYDRGGTSTNRAEAEAVVAEIVRRLREPASPANRSIGAVTFSQAQQTLVQDLLDEAVDADPLVAERLAEAGRLGEPVFVKNLENVQGDERATMLFSVCYGKDSGGGFNHSFGPLNLAGGERRLNVAVTRAREKVVVFSSIRASDLDPAKCVSRGAQDLRSYLAYAELGTVPPTAGGPRHGREPRTGAAEELLAARLRARGFTVEALVGRSADFRVSLAVGRPGEPERWRLGVDLDGQFHRSAPSVLDREATRIGVLVDGLKWNLVRVSIVDLFRDPDGTVARIAEAAGAASG